MKPAAPGATPLTVLPYLKSGEDGSVRLLATRCTDCDYRTFPPSTVCPHCMSLAVEPLALARTATLYSFTTLRHAGATTYGGYVDFPENIRVFGHLRGFSAEQPPHCGMAVEIVPATPVEGAKTSAPVDFNFQASHPQAGDSQ